jgi:hypothetical protein
MYVRALISACPVKAALRECMKQKHVYIGEC